MTGSEERFRIPPSDEVRDEGFWRKGGGFHWMWPVFFRVTPVDKRFRVTLNRYPHNIIGIGVTACGRAITVNWKGSSSRSRYKTQRGLFRRGRSA
jgi:hypothetical protein